MRFLQDDEDRMIAETLDRALRDIKGTDASAQLAELGVWGARMNSDADSGGGARLVSTVAQALGRHRVTCDYLPAAVLAGEILTASDDPEARATLDDLAQGMVRVVPALLEPGRRFRWAEPVTRAEKTADGHALSGTKTNVPYAEGAAAFLVAASLDGRPAVFLIKADTPGLGCVSYPSFAGQPLATLTMQGAHATLIVGPDTAPDLLNRIAAVAAFVAASEILGACDGAMEKVLAYLPVREQFGRKLSKFQALQHRCADLHTSIEILRSMVVGTLNGFEAGWSNAVICDAAASAAMAFEVGDVVGREAIHLHGAIGMTRDLGVGQYLLRINELSRMYGDASEQRRRVLALTLEAAE